MCSNGEKLLHTYGVTQAVCFKASSIDDETRLSWSHSFPKEKYRGDLSRVNHDSLFLVISQNCDISVSNDALDSAIEIAVCKRIRSKQVYQGNQFANSSRMLQFCHDGNWYQASAELILTVEKDQLLAIIECKPDFELIHLSKEYQVSVPIWRSNRYYRSGLPNNFNKEFFPQIKKHIGNIQGCAQAQHPDFTSYIRAMYIKIDAMGEVEHYTFELFALLRSCVDDKTMSAIQNAIESFANELSDSSGFTDNSEIYADREKNTYISYLNDFLRLNFDYHSLSQGDDDIGPEL